MGDVARIRLVNYDDMDNGYKKLLREASRMTDGWWHQGGYPNHFRLEANSPLYKLIWKAEKTLWNGIGNITPELMGYIFYAVSTVNGSSYCTGAACSIFSSMNVLDMIGSTSSKSPKFSRLSTKEKAAVQFALKSLENPHSVNDRDIKRMKQSGFTDADLLNIVHAIDVVSFSNRANIIFRTEYDHKFPSKDIPI